MTPAADPSRSWHSISVTEAATAVDAPETGLTAEEVDRRLRHYGPNRLRPPPRRGPIRRFLLQFHNVLIYVLLAAAAVAALLGQWVDAGVVAGVVVLNAFIGFLQEGKAERALLAIRAMLAPQALVVRDGRRMVVIAEALVPGDRVILRAGDGVSADLRLARVKGLRIDEALLTGESAPVEKSVAPVEPAAPLADRTPMAYAGTLVTYGQGEGIVVGTGDATEIGRIGTMLAEVETLATPLVRKLDVFARWLTFVILVVAAAMFVFGVLARGYTAAEMFMVAVGLAVAAIPEGLPAIMTIALAIGVERMAARNAIVRLLPAVETLGSVTTICSDKTGTLTRNEMAVDAVAATDGDYVVGGVGYGPEGHIAMNGVAIDPIRRPRLLEIARAGALCNEATLRREGDAWVMEGDPTEGALLSLALKTGLDADAVRIAMPAIDMIPFESEHRFMATLHREADGRHLIVVKGAPERILSMCSTQRSGEETEPLDADRWHREADALARRGDRLLAIACKEAPVDRHTLDPADVEGGLTMLGLFGLIDPPRAEAVEAVGRCLAAGIGVKMITGDHARTAEAIGRHVGLGIDGKTRTMTGVEIDALSDDDLIRLAPDIDVFARTSPEHKLRLVKALQAAGHVTAMTGDGVNDAPALKRADVGIAMGVKGTETAKQAAEMVLADDNFATIGHAVEQGRAVYANLKKSIVFILPTNSAEAITIIGAIAMGSALPITAVQILWINMVTTVTLALALAYEPPEPGIMRHPPRRPDAPLLDRFLLWRILYVTMIAVSGTFGLFLWEIRAGTDIETARTIAVNTLVMFEAFYVFNARRIHDPVAGWDGIFGNRVLVGAFVAVVLMQVGFTYWEPAQTLFGTRPLAFWDWVKVLCVSFPIFLLVEAEKHVLGAIGRGGRRR